MRKIRLRDSRPTVGNATAQLVMRLRLHGKRKRVEYSHVFHSLEEGWYMEKKQRKEFVPR